MQVEEMHCFRHHNDLLSLLLWSKSAIGPTMLSRCPLILALSLTLLLLRPSYSRVDVRNGAVTPLGRTARREIQGRPLAFTVKGDERFGVSTVLAQLS
jgi:hypothetical protein